MKLTAGRNGSAVGISAEVGPFWEVVGERAGVRRLCQLCGSLRSHKLSRNEQQVNTLMAKICAFKRKTRVYFYLRYDLTTQSRVLSIARVYTNAAGEASSSFSEVRELVSRSGRPLGRSGVGLRNTSRIMVIKGMRVVIVLWRWWSSINIPDLWAYISSSRIVFYPPKGIKYRTSACRNERNDVSYSKWNQLCFTCDPSSQK